MEKYEVVEMLKKQVNEEVRGEVIHITVEIEADRRQQGPAPRKRMRKKSTKYVCREGGGKLMKS